MIIGTDSLATLDGIVTFLGCVCLAFPVVVSLALGWISFSDWRARRTSPRRLPTSSASNVTLVPRGHVFDWLEGEDA